jgi:predicted HAD superfamily Cof-like phosphohydrolase
VDGSLVSFVDGSTSRFDAIVLATGYRADLPQLVPAADRVRDRRGQHRPFGGADAPGLFLVGFRNVATGLLREMGIEAAQVAQVIHRANLAVAVD